MQNENIKGIVLKSNPFGDVKVMSCKLLDYECFYPRSGRFF